MVKNDSGRAMRIKPLWHLPQSFLGRPGPARAGVPFPGGHFLPPTHGLLQKYPLTASHMGTSENWKGNKPICISST